MALWQDVTTSCHSGNVVLDIGANEGFYGLWAC